MPIIIKTSWKTKMRKPEEVLIGSPVRASSSTRNRQRYLESVITHVEDHEGIWHVLTSLPDYDYLQTACNRLTEAFKAQREYNALGTDLYNFLYSNWGVYYKLTNRDFSACLEKSLHMGQDLIFEKLNNMKIRDKDHLTKAKNTLSWAKRILNTLINAQLDNPKHTRLIQNTVMYLSWHIKALAVAINYGQDKQLCSTDLNNETPETKADALEVLRAWHPEEKAKITPCKYDSPVKRVQYMHQATQMRARSLADELAKIEEEKYSKENLDCSFEFSALAQESPLKKTRRGSE